MYSNLEHDQIWDKVKEISIKNVCKNLQLDYGKLEKCVNKDKLMSNQEELPPLNLTKDQSLLVLRKFFDMRVYIVS